MKRLNYKNLTLQKKQKSVLKQYLKQERGESWPKLVKKADLAIGNHLKKERGYKCIRCQKVHESCSRNLTISHYWAKKIYGSVRWDEENLDLACWLPCHKYFLEPDKQGWYRDYKIKQLGKEGYERLEIRARSITKYSRQDLKILIQYYENLDD